MQVDFNNLREQALYTYNRLCVLLNNHIQDKPHDPVINIDPETIQEEMDELRGFLWGIACSYLEGCESFRSLGDEIEDDKIAHFNPED